MEEEQVTEEQISYALRQATAGAREQPLTPAPMNILRKEREQRDDTTGYIFKPRGPARNDRSH